MIHRLDRWLSQGGWCSRREAPVFLRRVVATDGAGRRLLDPAKRLVAEDIRLDGEPLDAPHGLLVRLHKPAGLVCSHDPAEGPSVYDLLPPRWRRRNPPVVTVGRLDKDTTGVLLLTDMGALVQRWTSPRAGVAKLYEVEVDRDLGPDLIAVFASGTLFLDGEAKPCLPARLEIIGPRAARLELEEGRYHQVKRMFAARGWLVTRLHRAGFGDFTAEGLAPGQWEPLPLPNATPAR